MKNTIRARSRRLLGFQELEGRRLLAVAWERLGPLGSSIFRGEIQGAFGDGPEDVFYAEGFEGALGSEWTLQSSSNDGSIALNAAGEPPIGGRQDLLLTKDGDVRGPNTNEAILAVRLEGRDFPVLQFAHLDVNDEDDALPPQFTGSYPGDGVSVSDDGIHWTRLTNLNNGNSPNLEYQTFTLDVARAAQASDVSLAGDVFFKFQQHDDSSFNLDGRKFDEVRLLEGNGPRQATGVFLEEGQTLSLVAVPDQPQSSIQIRVVDPLGGLVGESQSDEPGGAVVLRDLPTRVGGEYLVEIGGDLPSSYSVELILNATIETELGTDAAPQSVPSRMLSPGAVALGIVGEFDRPPSNFAVWGAQPASGLIVRIDPRTGAVLNSFPPPDPLGANDIFTGLTAAESGATIRYVNPQAEHPNRVYRLDPNTGATLGFETLPATGALRAGLSFGSSEADDALFVASIGGGVDRWNGADLIPHVAGVIDLAGALGGDDVDGRRHFVVRSGEIQEFDSETPGAEPTTIGPSPLEAVTGLAFDGSRLYLSDALGSLVTLNAATGQVLESVTVEGGALGSLAATPLSETPPANGGLLRTPPESSDAYGAPAESGRFPSGPSAATLSSGGEELLTNGSFETGDFTGWRATVDRAPFRTWSVGGGGEGGGFAALQTQPQEGRFVAWHGFDGEAGTTFRLEQDVTLPDASLELRWLDRTQFNKSLGDPFLVARSYRVEIRDPESGATLETVYAQQFGPGDADSAWSAHSFDVSHHAGNRIRLAFVHDVPESFTGPGQFELDAVSLTAERSGSTDEIDEDRFELDLSQAAGPVNVILQSDSEDTDVSVELIDSNDVVVARASGTGAARILAFAPTEPRLELRVEGAAAASYSAVVTRGALLDDELRATDEPQDLAGESYALGYLGASEPTADLELRTAFESLEFGVDSGFFPPDPIIAAGRDVLVAMVNTDIVIHDKADGSVVVRADLDGPGGFWPTDDIVFDPWIVFDPHSNRFFAIGVDRRRGTTASSRIHLAVSKTDSPSNLDDDWHKFELNRTGRNRITGRPTFPDYPKLGVNREAIFITGNDFGINGGGLSHVSVFALEKESLLSGGEPRFLLDDSLEGAMSVHPVLAYDDASTMYFVESSFTGGGGIRVWELEDVSEPNWRQTLVPVQPFRSPPDVPQLNGPPLNSVDARLMSGVLRNGRLWTSHAVQAAGGGETFVRWYEIDAGSGDAPALVQSGDIRPGLGRHAWTPHINVDRDGDMAIGFSVSSPSEFASIAYTGRLSTDPLGKTRPLRTARQGEGPYSQFDSIGRNRWGDYSGLALDPDGQTFWLYNEYPTGDNAWATFGGSFSVDPRILPPDTDPYRLDLERDDILEIAVQAPFRSQINQLAPRVSLLDPAGVIVASDFHPGGDAALRWRVDQPGAYTILVTPGDDVPGEYVLDINRAPQFESLSLDQRALRENDVLTLTGSVRDADVRDSQSLTVAWGDGAATEVELNSGSFSVAHRYLDNTLDEAYEVTLRLTDDRGLGVDRTETVAVRNVAPTNLTATVEDAGGRSRFATPGEVVRLTGTFEDAGTVDQHRVVVNWGDGGPPQTLQLEVGARNFVAEHEYEFGGIFDVIVTVHDDDGESDATRTNIFVTGVRLDSALGVLQIVGTAADDWFSVRQIGDSLRIVAHFDRRRELDNGVHGQRRFDFQGVALSAVRAVLGDGDDWFAGLTEAPISAEGDEGNDVIFGGSGDDLLVGGAGDDRLYGRGGNDVVVGGAGLDRLNGGRGDDLLVGGLGADDIHGQSGADILIGGDLDASVAQMRGALDFWAARHLDYGKRVEMLLEDWLPSSLVTDDRAADRMHGGLGRDLFFAAINGDGADDLRGRHRLETLVRV